MDKIKIENLEVSCKIGLFLNERITNQRLIINAELIFETEKSAHSESLSDSIDYALVAQQINFVLQVGRFKLLETAAHAVAKLLLMPPAIDENRVIVESINLKIQKPEALKSYANASIEISRNKSWAQYIDEEKFFGNVNIIHETQNAGIYRLSIAPGKSIPMHEHRIMEESEFILTDGILCQHLPAPIGSVRHWPKSTPHIYENPTSRWQSILCIDRPKFSEEDEVPVSSSAAEVPFIPGWF